MATPRKKNIVRITHSGGLYWLEVNLICCGCSADRTAIAKGLECAVEALRAVGKLAAVEYGPELSASDTDLFDIAAC